MTAREFERALELVHPDVEVVVRTPPGEVLRGAQDVARFLHEVVAERPLYEVSISRLRALDERRIVAEGRMRWMEEDRVLRDDPVVWALELEEGLLRRSTPVRTASEAEALLSAARGNNG